MRYSDLLRFARANTQSDIPGLIRKRFLLVRGSGRIIYDEFLSLVRREGISSPITRKVMLFTWLYRDDRLRRFVTERISDPQGHWDPRQLTDIANGAFFRQWYSGGAKARSNFEYFLVETGIYDNRSQRIHLELDDGWLEDGARVAAQHEPDPEARRQLSENPYKYLVDRGWNALANSTSEGLLGRRKNANFAVEPVEDDLIPTSPARKAPFRTWNRPKPSSIEKTTTESLINLVARERANQSHHAIEQALADKIRQRGYDPQFNDHIDLFYSCSLGSVIFEVKSCTENNIHSQIRKGISQLYEYRYIYGTSMTAPIHLVLVLEVEPSRESQWLIDYLRSIEITPAWADPGTGLFKTASSVAGILTGILQHL